MSQITPQLVKELREKTGAGMGDCKNALQESNGDMQGAIEILRKKGAASAAKRAERTAKEGLIVTRTSPDGKTAVIVEVNCETDFVARNAEFDKYVNIVADTYLAGEASNLDELMALKVDHDTLLGMHNEILAKFSENISVRRFEKVVSNGFVAEYIHAGSKLAVLVDVSSPNLTEKSRSLVRDIAMQIAAMNPMFVDRSRVSQEVIDKEKEIYTEQVVAEGKKPEMAERIVNGRLEKFFQEQCLVEQTFVKDPSKTINDVIKDISADSGEEVKINDFRRYYLGEA